MANQEKSQEELKRDVQELRDRLEVAEETLRAIRQGEVDALVVLGAEGEQVYTLQGADYPYRIFVEEMNEGAATLTANGILLYCNSRFASLLQKPLKKVIGSDFKDYLAPPERQIFQRLLQQAQSGVGKGEVSLIASNKQKIPVQLTINSLDLNGVKISCVIVTDLTEQKYNEEIKQHNETLEKRVRERTVELAQANSQLQCELQERQQAERQLELQAVITQNMAEGVCLIRAADQAIVYTNAIFERIFGYEPGELLGKHVSVVNYDDKQTNTKDVARQISEAILEHGEVTYEVHNVKKDGTPFWCQATTSTFNHPDYGTVFVAVQQDITEQKIVEEKILASLQEKEVLLKEIHHRVKNNLQIVSSLLQMQARRTQDEQATLVLQDSQNRIASIALIHEKLYRSENLANIDFAQYIPDLITHLFDSYNISSDRVNLIIKIDNIFLEIDIAIPCGLIVNELVSNSLKYAFSDNRTGEIHIEFYANGDGTLTLTVRDNGIGIPQAFDIENTLSLGLTLVQGLSEQLEGTLELDRSRGTEFKITFPGGST